MDRNRRRTELFVVALVAGHEVCPLIAVVVGQLVEGEAAPLFAREVEEQQS